MLLETGDTRVIVECGVDKGWVEAFLPGASMKVGYGTVIIKRDRVDVRTRDDIRYSLRIMGSQINVRRKIERENIEYGKVSKG
jgi:hypothetical protein